VKKRVSRRHFFSPSRGGKKGSPLLLYKGEMVMSIATVLIMGVFLWAIWSVFIAWLWRIIASNRTMPIWLDYGSSIFAGMIGGIVTVCLFPQYMREGPNIWTFASVAVLSLIGIFIGRGVITQIRWMTIQPKLPSQVNAKMSDVSQLETRLRSRMDELDRNMARYIETNFVPRKEYEKLLASMKQLHPELFPEPESEPAQ
jgi:hypothetical protein